jgi:hypothetical protein
MVASRCSASRGNDLDSSLEERGWVYEISSVRGGRNPRSQRWAMVLVTSTKELDCDSSVESFAGAAESPCKMMRPQRVSATLAAISRALGCKVVRDEPGHPLLVLGKVVVQVDPRNLG